MAKRTKAPKQVERVIIKERDDDDDDLLEQTQEELEDAGKLSDFLDQFGGKEYKVRVEQMNPVDKVWEHIDLFPYDGFDAFETCKRFGPGRYRLSVLNERGKYVKGGQPQIRIAGVVKPAVVEAAKVEQDPLKHPIVVMMLAQMEKSNQQTTELLKAMLAKPEPQKSSSAEVLDMLAKLKAMNPEKKEDQTMQEVSKMLLLRMIEKGMDGGDGGEKSTWQEIVEGLKDVKDLGIMEKLGAGLMAARQPGKTAPAPTPAPQVRVALPQPPAPEVPPAMPEPSPLEVSLKPFAAILATKAESGVDPKEAAAYVHDEFYETVIPLVKKHVFAARFMSDAGMVEYACGAAQDAEQVEKLFAFAPELAAHREWTLAVIAEAVRLATSPEEAATDGAQS